MKNLFCENCLDPIKTMRDILIGEYYSRDCKCGHYDKINYHMRNYLYLDVGDIKMIKRSRRISLLDSDDL